MIAGDEQPDSRRRDRAALALLLALTAFVFADVLFFGQRLFIRDLANYYYPTKKIVREAMLDGRIPYWNWSYSAGQPMAANPEYAVFYPPHLLLLLPDYDFAFQLLIVLHVAMAAIGAYRLFRSMEMRVASSLFGAMTYAFGGLFASVLNLLPYLFILTWLPWAFVHVRRWLTIGGRRDMALASLFLGLQVLTAEPTTLVQVWMLIGFYGLYRIASSDDRARAFGRIAPRVALILLATLAVGFVQLLPALDHVRDSVRSTAFPFKTVTSWSMPPLRPIELVLPGVFGHVYREGANAYWGSLLYGTRPIPFLFSIYLGIFGFCLLVAGLRARLPGSGLLAGVCAFSFVWALGGHTPLYRWLYDAGLARTFRYPEKFAIMALIAIIVFQARALDQLLKDPAPLLRTARGTALVVSGIAGLIFASLFLPGITNVLRSLTGIGGTASLAELLRETRIDWGVNLLRCVLAVSLLRAVRPDGASRRWVAGLLLFVAADLALAGWAVEPRIGQKFFDPPPVAERLDPNRSSYRIFPLSDWYATYGSSPNGNRFAQTGAGTYWTQRNGLVPTLPSAWGFQYALEIDYDGTALLPTTRFVNALWKLRDEAGGRRFPTLMTMANIRYWSRYRDFRQEMIRVKGRVEDSEPLDLVEVGPAPRYYFADSVTTIRNDADFIRQLIERDPGPHPAFVEAPAFVPAPGRVRSVAESRNGATIDVIADGRALLVMSVTPHKYWRATIDEKPAKLLRANVGFQAIEVPKGPHRVRIAYRNPLVLAGAEVSLVAIVLLAGIALSGARRGRLADAMR